MRCLFNAADPAWRRVDPRTAALVARPEDGGGGGGGGAGAGRVLDLPGLSGLEFPRHVAQPPAWAAQAASLAVLCLVRPSPADNAAALEARLLLGGGGARRSPRGAPRCRGALRRPCAAGGGGGGGGGEGLSGARWGLEARPEGGERRPGDDADAPADGAAVRAELVPLTDARTNAAALEDRLAALAGGAAGGAAEAVRAELVPLADPRRNAAVLEDRLAAPERLFPGPAPLDPASESAHTVA